MGIEELKINFLNYLKQKSSRSEESLENEDTSSLISRHSEEFKKYLVYELGYDSSIFTKNLSEIAKMSSGQDSNNSEIDENTLAELKDLNFAEILAQEEANQDNAIKTIEQEIFSDSLQDTQTQDNQFIDGTETTNEVDFTSGEEVELTDGVEEVELTDGVEEVENPDIVEQTEEVSKEKEEYDEKVQKLLDTLYENKTAIKVIDEDGDGVLSSEEKEKFEEYIKGYDNPEELTELAVQRAYKDIVDGKFSYDVDLEERVAEIEKEKADKKAKEEEKAKEAQQTQSAGSVGGGGGGGSYGSSGVSSNQAVQQVQLSDEEQIAQLEAEKSEYTSELTSKEEKLNELSSGESTEMQAANKEVEDTQKAYDEAVENDDKISEETKTRRDENLKLIAEKENSINQTQVEINNKTTEIFNQETLISQTKSNLSALEASLSTLQAQSSDDEEKQKEIESKISELNSEIPKVKEELAKQEESLKEMKEAKTGYETTLKEEQDALKLLEEERAEIEEEIAKNCSPETKIALEAFQAAKAKQAEVKQKEQTEIATLQQDIVTLQNNISQIDSKINEIKAKQTQEEYKVSDFNFDFEDKLSSGQAADLETFKQNFEQNKEKYEKVAEATGVPAELVAALHWRESSGNFSTYLHNGQPLGQTTTIVPKGIYFEDWTEAAIDAISTHNPEIVDKDNIETWYDYAERYNGLGYRNKGLPSPYVWAGTSNYSSGKYVRDGVFDPNHVDQQLGVAIMLKSLLS